MNEAGSRCSATAATASRVVRLIRPMVDMAMAAV